jgi:hypothetical protein
MNAFDVVRFLGIKSGTLKPEISSDLEKTQKRGEKGGKGENGETVIPPLSPQDNPDLPTVPIEKGEKGENGENGELKWDNSVCNFYERELVQDSK